MKLDTWLQLREEPEQATNGQRYRVERPAPAVRHLPLLVLFNSLGRARQSAAGLEPLTWPDLQAYVAVTGDTLSAQESDSIMLLSRVYVTVARDPKAPCPVDQTEISEAKYTAAVSSWLRAAGVEPEPALTT